METPNQYQRPVTPVTPITPVPNAPDPALGELVRLNRIQTDLLSELRPSRFRIRLVQYCIIAFMLAWFFTSVWIFIYLTSVSISFTSLIEYVHGNEVGSTGGFGSTEVLFVVVSRFTYGLGIMWLPLTIILSFLDIIRQALFGRDRQ